MNTEQNRISFDSRPPTWVLLLLSGALLGMAYPPNPVGLLGSIGLVPLLLAVDRARSFWEAFRWSYLSLLLFSALTTWWVGSWQAKTDPFLMISCVLLVLIHPLFFVLPILLYRAVRLATSRFYALAFLPFLWCGGEYLHALSDASYPWLTLGNTQTYNLYYIQFIEFTGVWGLSFLLLVQNSAFTAMLFALDRAEGEQKSVYRTCAAILAFTLVPPFLYGFYILGEARKTIPERGITVTVVQPNVDPWDKWKSSDTTDHIRLNADYSRASLREKPSDMFLWSENAIPYPVTSPEYGARAAALRSAIDSLGVPVLTGFPDYLQYPATGEIPRSAKYLVRPGANGVPDTARWDYFNSVGLFVPGVGLKGLAYHKMQLVPFGERIPFVDNVPWLMDLLSWDVGISTWGKGSQIVVFDVPYRDSLSTKAATVICFESIYPDIVRQFVASGAEFLTIITNDGWYMGTPGPVQHKQFAILRAIETRRSIARAANTGISCYITPYGQITAETEEDVTTTITSTIELRDDRTLYVLWGDWWPQLCLAIAGVLGGYAVIRRARREKAPAVEDRA